MAKYTDAAGYPIKFEGQFDGRKFKQQYQETIQDFIKDLKKTSPDMFEGSNESLKRIVANSQKAKSEIDQLNKASSNQNLREAQLATQQALRDSRLEIARLKEEQQKLRNEQEQAKVKAQEYRAEIERLKAAEQTLRNEFQKGRITQQQYDTQIRQNRADQTALSGELARSRIAQQQYRTELTKLTLEQRKQSIASKEARVNMTFAVGSYNEMNQRAKELLATIKNMPQSTREEIKAVNQKVSEYNRMNESLKQFDARLGNHQRNVGNYSSALNGISSRLADMAAAWISVGTAMALVNKSFASSMRTDAMTASLNFILKNGDLVQRKIRMIQKEADRLGLEYVSLAETYRSFTGAAQASNFSLDKADKIFLAVANAAGKLKLSSDQTAGALLALQQMISKGNVQAEELRGQLGERIPGAFAIAARAMGVTELQLNKMLQRGEVLAADLLPKLADELDRTFSNDKSERVDSLQASVNRLKNTFDVAVQEGNVSKFFNAIVNGANNALQAITKTVNSNSFKEFFMRFISLNDPLARGVFGRELQRAETTKGGQKSYIDDTVDEFKGLTRDEQTKALRREQAVYASLLKDYEKGDKSLQDALSKQTDLVSALERAFKTAYSEGKKQVVEVADEDLKSISEIQKRLADLRKMTGSAISGSDIDKRIKTLQSRLKELNGTGDGSALKRQRDLQDKIDNLNKSAFRKQLTQNEEEVQAVHDKYNDIRKEIKNFYDDPLNKGKKVDASGLAASEQKEVDEAVAKQQLEIEKQTYEQKKALFDEYEKYKKQVGKEKANEAFKEDLEGFNNYLEYLRSKMPKETDTSPLANKTRDYLNNTAIPVAQKEQQKRDAELFRQSLLQAQTYADQIKAIQQKLDDDISRIKGKASEEQIDALKKNAQDEISAITNTAIKEETNWEKVFENLGDMSTKAAKRWIDDVEKAVEKNRKQGDLTVKDYQDWIKKINGARSVIDSKNPFSGLVKSIGEYREARNEQKSASDGLNDAIEKYGENSNEAAEAQIRLDIATKNVSVAFRKMAGDVSNIANIAAQSVGALADGFQQLGIGGEDLQDTLHKVENVLGGVSQLGQGLATHNPIDIIAGSIKTLTSVISLFNNRDKRLQKQIQGYQDALKSLERQYNQLQRAMENSVGNSYYDDAESALKNQQEQIAKLTASRDAESKKKKADKDAIDGYNDAIIQAQNEMVELQKQISQNLLQTDYKQLSQNLSDALLSAFEAGEDGIDALNKSFDQFIKNALVNTLRLKILEPLMKDMADKLTAYMLNNGDSLIGFDFNPWRAQLDAAGTEFSKALEEAYAGLGLSKEGSSTGSSGLSGTIGRSITEDTANKWMGVQMNMYTIAKNHFAEAQSQSKMQQALVNFAQRNLDTALGIERNTAETVNQLKTAVNHLATIVSNTGGSKTSLRDMGR